MSNTSTHPDLQQDCLDKLSRVLDLVLKSAETASARNDHKMVIQASREITRISALIFKMTSAKTNSPAPRAKATAPAGNNSQAAEIEIEPADLILPDLDTLFPPRQVASWDGATKSMYETFTKNYREFQNLCDELASGLPVTGRIPALIPNRQPDSAAAPCETGLPSRA